LIGKADEVFKVTTQIITETFSLFSDISLPI